MKQSIAIIGGGTSALMLAAMLDTKKFDVTIYERNNTLARKFLVAGKGGFNLTHSEDTSLIIKRYTPSGFFSSIISSFTNTDLMSWLKHIGIETYTGTSRRVFPIKGTKPITVLNAFLKKIQKQNVLIKTQHTWQGWADDQQLVFNYLQETVLVKPDFTIFALGGSSWKITGSDGTWLSHFENQHIQTIPFQASNCNYRVQWSEHLLQVAEGKSLKNICVHSNGDQHMGEVLITKLGLEGNAIYSLSGNIRKQLAEQNTAILFIDLKPQYTVEKILEKLANKGSKSLTKHLENELNMNRVQLALLKFCLTKEEFINPEVLAAKLKQLPITITAAAPIDEAISTVGGIDLNEINSHFEFKKLPNHFAIGEMLNWDAPTGGYLIQGCFSMGHKLAEYLNSHNKP